MSFDLNITVNGNRCKQYHHEGKTFIEAKDGSEYVIEIKNNHGKRVLAVGSVDGLNILTGKTASERDSGYIIGAYSAEKIKGFRFSDDSWAMFKFGYKFNGSVNSGNTYAESKGDGSERNCGVIGMRLFYEKEPLYTVTWNSTPTWMNKPATTVTTTTTTYPSNFTGGYSVSSSWPIGNNCTASYAVNASYVATGGLNKTVNYCCNDLATQDVQSPYSSLFGGCAARGDLLKEAIADAKAVRATGLANSKGGIICADVTKGGSSKKMSKAGGQSAGDVQTDRNSLRDRFNRVRNISTNAYTRDVDDSLSFMEMEREVVSKPEFDLGTEWGRKEKSKVQNVTFERGCLAQSIDIYYASRESLIAMGVPITNELAVNLPQSFPSEYAQPPAGWVG